MLANNSFARKLHDAALGLVRWDAAFVTAFAFCIALVVLNGCGALPERESSSPTAIWLAASASVPRSRRTDRHRVKLKCQRLRFGASEQRGLLYNDV